MKIAILGGSFNPVHLGHLFLADTVLASGYDRVVLVPAYQSPFKLNAEGASPEDRLEMLCASVAADSRIAVDNTEIRRGGVSYTVDTVADIIKRYRPDGKPALVLGDDLSESFHLWKSASLIAEETDIIVARRLGDSANYVSDENGRAVKGEFPYPHIKLENNLMEISSRQVREEIRSGGAWRYLVPAGARYIIEGRGLYGFRPARSAPPAARGPSTAGGPPTSGGLTREAAQQNPVEVPGRSPHETAAAMEHIARETLDIQRFLHSRNTALFALDLCVRFAERAAADSDAEPGAAYLAGITHDLCKSMPQAEILSLAESDGLPVSGLEREKPFLLHGRAAAVLLETRYNITDRAVLEAVRFHVSGGPAMGLLAKIIYIADKLEVSRPHVKAELRELCSSAGLDELFAAVVKDNVDYLALKNLELTAETRELLSSLEKNPKKVQKSENS